jgi:ATPase (PilT family)
MTKLIIVEGTPGSGKSTFAQKIAGYYRDKDITVNLFNEGQAHPADLAWSACVPLDSLDKLLSKYSVLEDEIRKNMHLEGGNSIIAYTRVKTDNVGFYEELENYEVYDKRVTMDEFCNLHYHRWEEFGVHAAEQDSINIFECAFFQNHINELQNFHLTNKACIESHLNRLIASVLNLSPVLIYLSQPNIRETIERIAKERVSEYGNWIDVAVSYVENSPYGKINNLKGFDGLIRCIEDRKQIELDVLGRLPIRSIIIDNPDFNWEDVWNKLKTYLCTL